VIAPKSRILDHRDFVIETFEDLGFIINYEKSILVPHTQLEFIGHLFDSCSPEGQPWIYATSAKIKKLKKDIKRAIDKGCIQARLLAKIAGQAIYISRAILPGKLKLRSLYALLRMKQSWSDTLLIDSCTLTDLKWWIAAIEEWNGSPLHTQPVQVQLSTDSSGTGRGCVCVGIQASGTWDPDTANKHINYKELLAVLMGLQSFSSRVRQQSIQVLTDNSTTVAYINNMGGPVRQLSDLAEQIWAFVLNQKANLVAKHICGVLNTEADYLSRLPIQYEWMLHPTLFRYIDQLWGPHTLDRFASISTAQIDTYNSRFLDPQTHGVDALVQTDWQEHNNWVNPPFRLLNRVIDVVVQQKAYATVIAPCWPGQPWFHRLVSLLVAPPFRIPRGHHTMLRMGEIAEPLKNPRWRLYAWRICGDLGSQV
jgi:hypothetical protein